MKPENPNFEWILQIKSKSGFLKFMIRAIFLGKDPEKVQLKMMQLAQCMLISFCHGNKSFFELVVSLVMKIPYDLGSQFRFSILPQKTASLVL